MSGQKIKIIIRLKNGEIHHSDQQDSAINYMSKQPSIGGSCKIIYRPGVWNEFEFSNLDDFQEKFSEDTNLKFLKDIHKAIW